MNDIKKYKRSVKVAGAVFIASMLLAASLLFPATTAFAGDRCGNVDVSIDLGCTGAGNPLFDLARALMATVSALVGIVIVGAIVVGGIGYASASNDKKQVKRSVSIIRGAIIGLLLYIGFAAIINALVPGGFF